MAWLGRNAVFLISGIFLLPTAAYALLMWIAFGYGFAHEQSKYAVFVAPLILSFFAVYVLSIRFALKRLKLCGSYGYWDVLPVFYFSVVFLFFFSGNLGFGIA
jgi:predicted neutral ceramidase superfamily lipid hydrolase